MRDSQFLHYPRGKDQKIPEQERETERGRGRGGRGRGRGGEGERERERERERVNLLQEEGETKCTHVRTWAPRLGGTRRLVLTGQEEGATRRQSQAKMTGEADTFKSEGDDLDSMLDHTYIIHNMYVRIKCVYMYIQDKK